MKTDLCEERDDLLGAVAVFPVADQPLGVASVDEVLALGRQEAKNDCNERKQPLLGLTFCDAASM